jgi:hypothetical protein
MVLGNSSINSLKEIKIRQIDLTRPAVAYRVPQWLTAYQECCRSCSLGFSLYLWLTKLTVLIFLHVTYHKKFGNELFLHVQ